LTIIKNKLLIVTKSASSSVKWLLLVLSLHGF